MNSTKPNRDPKVPRPSPLPDGRRRPNARLALAALAPLDTLPGLGAPWEGEP